MSVLGDLLARFGRGFKAAEEKKLPGEQAPNDLELGRRATPENATKYLYRAMWVDSDVRQAILEIRDMDRQDGRVKRVHGRSARAAVKGGLKIRGASGQERVHRRWHDFERRLGLNRREKLQSDMRGLMMEGNLPAQWVLDAEGQRVVRVLRMPTETLLPDVLPNGTFRNPREAYTQFDLSTGARLAVFPLWQLTCGRLEPDNFDDVGALGRPYLDASRAVWKKLTMTEEDLVIRRRMRAPLRVSHVLEGAGEEYLDRYRKQNEQAQSEGVTTDYYTNVKGSITALQGDASLDQIADVEYLLDTFFAGAPAPKGLFGYTGDLARDILDDLKRDYFDELDAMQDTLSQVYRCGFELELLLAGMDPDNFDFEVVFAERKTDTPNQRADLALKYSALGLPKRMVWDAAGFDAEAVEQELEVERERSDPFPDESAINPPQAGAGPGRVSVTPGNERKGESATTISTRSSQG